MNFNKDLLFSNNFKSREETVQALNNHTTVLGVYVVFIDRSDNTNSLLEFFKSSELFKLCNKNKNIEIIGLTESYYESIDMIIEIISINLEFIGNIKKFKQSLKLNKNK